jgi:superfamily II DNA or RNA helicase
VTGRPQLRPYQQDAKDAVLHAWASGTRAAGVVIPTGGGKTTIFTDIADEHVRNTPHGQGRRTLTIAHRKELIDAAAQRQREVSPDLTVGIVKAGQNQTLADMVVGSVQTLRNDARLRQLLDVGLVIVDEVHHAAADSYVKILRHFPNAKILGVTATFSRSDSRALGSVIDDVVYQIPISVLQAQGYLVHATGHRVGVGDLDLSKVRTTAGDYNADDLDRALSNSLAPQAIVRAVQEHALDDSAVVFTPTVHFAQVMALAFQQAGFTAAAVHAGTPDDERELIIKRVKSGDIQIICNCGILTEGTDIPRLKTAVIARLTKSEVLWIQMVGRVLRTFGSYTHAKILDVVGASAMHSLTARVQLFGEEAAESIEREPCDCLGESEWTSCRCGRRRCTPDCPCGGGAPGDCPCIRPEKIEPLAGDQEEPDDRVDGALVSVEVDLHHGSQNQWLSTHGGTWFIPAGQRFVAVVPGRLRGTWSSVSVPWREGEGSRYIQRDVPSKGYAMQWAEDDITRSELRYARKSRSWRALPVSRQQIADAERYEVKIPYGAHGGQVADLIAIEQASRRMDAGVELLKERQA